MLLQVAKLWTGDDGKPLKPDTFANEKTSTPDNLAKTENIDTITPALQTMFSSNATAAARMSRVQAGAEVMRCDGVSFVQRDTI